MSKTLSSIDHQQQRGAGWDVVDEAINSYDEWMLDDCYDGMDKLHEIIRRMRERRAAFGQAQRS